MQDAEALKDMLQSTLAGLRGIGVALRPDEVEETLSFVSEDLAQRYPVRDRALQSCAAVETLLMRRSFVFVLAERTRAVEVGTALAAAGDSRSQSMLSAIGEAIRASREPRSGGYDPREWELPSLDALAAAVPGLANAQVAHLALACLQSRMREQDQILERGQRDPRRLAASLGRET